MTKDEIDKFLRMVADQLNMIRDDIQRFNEKGEPISGRITQKEMAKLVGCSLPTWSEFECANSLPSAKVLRKLIDQGYDANWILSGKGQMKIGTGSDGKLDKTILSAVITAVWTEIENSGAKLTPIGIAGIISMAYDSYRINKDNDALIKQIGQLIEIASLGGQQ